jgi:hypothetical protein
VKVTESVCAKLAECVPFLFRINHGDMQNCVARASLTCPEAAPTGSTDTPQGGYNCARDVRAQSCSDFVARKRPATCTPPGRMGNGVACSWDDQCQTNHCARAGGQMCGTCGGYAGPGASCAVEEDCQPGLVCNGAGICVAPVAAGAACSNSLPCGYGLFCGSGICQALVQEAGGTCSMGGCSFAHGLYCNPQGKCQSIGVAPVGMTCGFINGGLTVCGEGVSCRVGAGQPTDVCGAPAADGAGCGPDRPCRFGADCINGVCRILNTLTCG